MDIIFSNVLKYSKSSSLIFNFVNIPILTPVPDRHALLGRRDGQLGGGPSRLPQHARGQPRGPLRRPAPLLRPRPKRLPLALLRRRHARGPLPGLRRPGVRRQVALEAGSDQDI